MAIAYRVLAIIGGSGLLASLVFLLFIPHLALNVIPSPVTDINGCSLSSTLNVAPSLIVMDKKGSSPRSTLNATQSLVMDNNGSTKELGLKSETQPDPSRPVLVLVLTYTRSGSSLTGDILQHSPNAFYLYEPFIYMGEKNLSSFVIEYADGSKRKPPYTFQEETYQTLYNWFTCNINKIPVEGLMHPFMTRAIKTNAFPLCFQRKSEKLKNKPSAVKVCARKLQRICSDSPFRIIKTVRLQLYDIKQLLEELPNLKIIHLMRDPRATLWSRAEIGWCASLSQMISCTNYYCKRLENNVLEEERLLKSYPGRITTVFYEDIARHPLQASTKLFNFIGADFTSDAQKYIYSITLEGQKDNCEICTTRSNATAHIDAWKKKININYVKIINERCNYILKRYSFDEFPLQRNIENNRIVPWRRNLTR